MPPQNPTGFTPPMAPDMSDYLNQTLQSAQIPAPPANPFLNGGGSPLQQALGNSMMFLANYQPSGNTIGSSISDVARAFMNTRMMKNQMQWQQAMYPMMMAQQMMNLRKATAPEAIKTDYGIVQRDPMSGQLAMGMSNFDIAGMSNPNKGISSAESMPHKLIMGMLPPDADEETKRRAESVASAASMMPDPMKQVEYVNNGMKQIFDDRRQRAQFDENLAFRKQSHEDSMTIRDMMARLAGQRLTLANDRWGFQRGMMEDKINMQFANKANELYEPALLADRRLAMMKDAIEKPNGQNDVAMLFNHIGMTGSAQKGFRMTDAEINRAIQTRSLPDAVLGEIQKMGIAPDSLYRFLGQDPKQLPPGGFLTPNQRQQMYDLGVFNRNVAWRQSRDVARVYGPNIMQYEPPSLPGLPQIGWEEAGAQGTQQHNIPNPMMPPMQPQQPMQQPQQPQGGMSSAAQNLLKRSSLY